jgi:hypothetical protein
MAFLSSCAGWEAVSLQPPPSSSSSSASPQSSMVASVQATGSAACAVISQSSMSSSSSKVEQHVVSRSAQGPVVIAGGVRQGHKVVKLVEHAMMSLLAACESHTVFCAPLSVTQHAVSCAQDEPPVTAVVVTGVAIVMVVAQ